MVCMPANSLTEYLDLVQPFVSDQLIDAAHWAAIAAVAQWLPSPITNFFGFECRLGNPTPQADFLLSVGAGEPGQRILAAQSPRYPLPSELLERPVWQQVRTFTQAWLEERSPLHANVSNLWLEFDVDELAPAPPVPSCFFGSPTLRAATPETTERPDWVTQAAIAPLQGRGVDPALAAQVYRGLAALPPEAHVFQVGLMLPRQVNWVRLCLRHLSPPQLLSYLRQLDWPGDLAPLQAQLTPLAERTDRIDLDLDIGPSGLSPKLGLECYLRQQPSTEPRWPAFLDFLVAGGLCLPQKRDALLHYPGYVRETDHRQQWPPHLLRLMAYLGSRYEGVFFRGLHHIKLVYQPDQMTEAKAYCWVSQQILSSRSPSLGEGSSLSYSGA